jgi:hypothetical protein
MHLTKMMLNTPAGKKQEATKPSYVGNYIAMNGLSGLENETQQERETRLALEQAYAFEKALNETKKDRESIFSLSDNDFELIPMYEAVNAGASQTQQKFVYKDQTISTAGYLATIAANCGTSYAVANQVMGDRNSDVGTQTDWVEDIVFSGAGFIASYLLGSVLTTGASFFEKKIEGIVTLPLTSDIIQKTTNSDGIEHIEVKKDAAEKIIKSVEETESYKAADLSTTKIINSAIAIANGAALAYHGYQRHSHESQGKRAALALGWGVGGLYGLTNLGYAFAQGYAKGVQSSPRSSAIEVEETTAFPMLVQPT